MIHHLLNLITCCRKQAPKKPIQKINKVHPTTTIFTIDESIVCAGCFNSFKLSDNELSVNCAGCNKFFHCKIAGKCDGEDCCITKQNGEIHKASYCYDCMELNKKNRKLCKDCFK